MIRQIYLQVLGALRSGELTRQPCEVCGVAQGEAHHDDYGKPLAVRWLCSHHHGVWHGQHGLGRHRPPDVPMPPSRQPDDQMSTRTKTQAWDYWIRSGDLYLTQQLKALVGALGYDVAARVAHVSRADLERWTSCIQPAVLPSGP